MRPHLLSCPGVSLAFIAALGIAAGKPAQSPPRPTPLLPEAVSIEQASPDLLDRLRADEYVYFRFVNRPWTARVCDRFAQVLPEVPVVQLHGDAHVEQYAVTSQTWGLDDFDDSARGPSLVDILRFLGSVELIARRRGWSGDLDQLFDRFFEGYRGGLAEPGALPEPEFVRRLRSVPPRSRVEHLALGEQMMEPLSDEQREAAAGGLDLFARLIHKQRPELAPGYFVIRRLGRLRVGVGSAATNKILFRVDGPSRDPDDDVLLETKEPSRLDGLGCLQLPSSTEALRVIAGSRQLGRIRHDILGVIPEYEPRHGVRKWWIRSWEPSYQEVRTADLNSIKDLSALVYDSGLQLGAGRVRDESPDTAASSLRRAELAAVGRLEARLRQSARQLIAEMLTGWQEFRDSIRVERRHP